MNRILLVEDDKEIIANLTEFLSAEGFSVKNATGQTAALEIIENDIFDLVLLDVSLADGNGFAVCSAIKSNTSMPVIFLTASGDEFSTVTGFELGADDYISKPFRPRELVSRIKNVLRLTGSGSITMTIKAPASRNALLRIYNSSNEVVAQIFVAAGSSSTIKVNPGTYTMKAAYGDKWYGDIDLFGGEGKYIQLKNGASTEFTLKKNYKYTLTLATGSTGNVGSDGVAGGADGM